MRTLMGCGLVLTLVFAASAPGADKADPDPKKLMGKWQPSGKDLPDMVKVVIEFAKEGKLNVEVTIGEKKQTKTGTYKLDGNKLTVSVEGDKTKTSTVEKLTDDTLEVKNETGKTTTMSRLKDK